jgi:peptidoglycan hydrolase-like amidase
MSNLFNFMLSADRKRAVITKKWAMSLIFFVVTAFFVSSHSVLAYAENTQGQPSVGTLFTAINQGKTGNINITIKNTGARTWKKGQVFLETGDFLKSMSKLQHSSWQSYYRIADLSADVLPGKSASFSISLLAPTGVTGDIQQNFQLVENGVQPIKGSSVRVFASITKASTVTAATTKPTTSTNTSTTNATPIAPAASTIYNNSTSNNSTIKTTTSVSGFLCSSTGVVTPEQIAALVNCNTSATEPSNTTGQSNINALKIEPMMRIGLFSSASGQAVTHESIVDITTGSMQLFSGVAANTYIYVNYSSTTKQYSVRLMGLTKYSNYPVRIVPRTKNAVATLVDYRATPQGSGTVRDNRFRNIIEFNYSTKTKKFWLINELPLSYYLKGLGETSNYSPVEFQKVMLAAARSYAMYHFNRGVDFKIPDGSTKHADEHFHLDSTYDQVYRGYSSEARMPTLVQAENETRGMVVSYQGKVIVTPYFSRSDGRTRSYKEVWGGDGMAWLQPVAVPQDIGKTLNGHGVGMSAQGALLMVVNEGKKWDSVIKYFYTGVDILKVY